MGELIRLPKPVDRLLARMSRAELIEEWHAQEDSLIDAEQDLVRLAEVLWPDAAERPDSVAQGATTVAEVVAGIRSLHEYVDRVLSENARLRAELRGA